MIRHGESENNRSKNAIVGGIAKETPLTDEGERTGFDVKMRVRRGE